MLYMVIEYFNAGAAPEIYRRVRERGRQLPPASSTWIAGWTRLLPLLQLMRTDDRSLLDVWAKAWGDLIHMEVIPVRTRPRRPHIADQPDGGRASQTSGVGRVLRAGGG